ncbi:MAG: wax ester/triacylglycerol synthase family O-acyltransferase [Halioglobus sp.]
MKISLFDHVFFKVEEVGMAPLPMGGAMILDPKTAPWKLTAQEVADHLAARMEKIPLMRQKPVQDKLNIGSIQLVDDPEFDVKKHLTVSQLKKPGGYKELAEHLGKFSQTPIPTDRPLWQFEVIEGLRGGKIAVATHIHHGILDGAGAMESLASLNDLSPIAPETPRQKKWASDTEPSPSKLIGTALLENLNRLYVMTPKLIGKTAGPLLRAGSDKVLSRLSGKDRKKALSATAEVTVHATSLNATGLSMERRVAWKTLKLSRIKQLGKRHECTVNDIALLLCSTAMDEYYTTNTEEVDTDQVAVMPFNVRTEADGASGNSVTIRSINLHTTQSNVIDRLKAIAADTRIIKQEVRPETKGPIDGKELMAVFSPFLLESALRLVSRFDIMGRIKMGNTMISNVPGAPVPLYVAGAAVETVIPMAPVVEGMALSCTIASTHEKLVIGFHSCAENLGNMDALLSGVDNGYKALS